MSPTAPRKARDRLFCWTILGCMGDRCHEPLYWAVKLGTWRKRKCSRIVHPAERHYHFRYRHGKSHSNIIDPVLHAT